MSHLIFYDGVCPLCNKTVRFVLAADKKKNFLFAPLNGTTAEKKLSNYKLANPDLDTLVLLQNYKTHHEQAFIEARAALRILWLLGGKYVLIGWLSFLPPFLFDWMYRWVARRRYRLFSEKVPFSKDSSRFLP
jgi:predicted DCC family thiol-disulfide oxidoreductase YuxK